MNTQYNKETMEHHCEILTYDDINKIEKKNNSLVMESLSSVYKIYRGTRRTVDHWIKLIG